MLMRRETAKNGAGGIGVYAKDDIESAKQNNMEPAMLSSDKRIILSNLHQEAGTSQVSRGQMSSAPSWLPNQSFKLGYDSNCKDAYE